jgi:hypothetical protein
MTADPNPTNDTPQTLSLIVQAIHTLRGFRVLLDTDLAKLYDIETKDLNRAVKRNLIRFPTDFMFQLTIEESDILRCQFGTAKFYSGRRRYLPFAFTQEGIAMLSGILNSERAIAVNIEIMRAFVRLRQVLAQHADLAKHIDGLEAQMGKHQGENEHHFRIVFEAIRRLIDDEDKESEASKIGFETK